MKAKQKKKELRVCRLIHDERMNMNFPFDFHHFIIAGFIFDCFYHFFCLFVFFPYCLFANKGQTVYMESHSFIFESFSFYFLPFFWSCLYHTSINHKTFNDQMYSTINVYCLFSWYHCIPYQFLLDFKWPGFCLF